jgi:tetratricopeptide (TPR) repeat protein
MRAFVFTDKALAERAGQFVWLSIDTEKKGNGPFLEKYPVEAWPSFFVLDPKSEAIALRWVGGATLPQLEKLLDDGRRAVGGGERGVDRILADADRLYGERKYGEAATRYRGALSRAGKGWRSYPRAVESLLFALHKTGDEAGCANEAHRAFRRLANTPSAANVAGSGLDCALRLPETNRTRGKLVSHLAADARKVLSKPRPDIAADDLSSLYGSVVDEREAAKDEPGKKRVASDWAAFLEREAAAAKTPQERAVFDPHRLNAYIALGQAERAIPMLKASEKDFPDDYNPPARLALAYEAMKQYERALMASDRALSKAYGPRLITLLIARSRIHSEKGDRLSARIAIEEAIREAEALPAGQRSQVQVASLKKKLEELPPPE